MTLEKTQIENLYTYFYSEYSNRLDKLETERIKKIEESEEYKTLFNKCKTFGEETAPNKNTYWIKEYVEDSLQIRDNCINSWSMLNKMGMKIKAILSTISQDAVFEDIVKLIENKLQLDAIINNFTNQ